MDLVAVIKLSNGKTITHNRVDNDYSDEADVLNGVQSVIDNEFPGETVDAWLAADEVEFNQKREQVGFDPHAHINIVDDVLVYTDP